MTTTEIPSSVKRLELVVYHLVPREFELANIYALGGTEPNAKYIAAQYGCQLEFRVAQFTDNPRSAVVRRHFDIAKTGECLSAVLVGEDREKLSKARDDIQRTFGASSFTDGTIDVSDEKTMFSR